jgi:hypothetical protein
MTAVLPAPGLPVPQCEPEPQVEVTITAPIPAQAPAPATAPARAPVAGPAGAAWIFALALELATDGVADEAAIDDLVDQAGANQRTLEGAYGRAVALLAEYPDDPNVREAFEILVRALRRLHRHAEA